MAAYVGHTKETLRAKTSTKNSNFPNGINGDTEVGFIREKNIVAQNEKTTRDSFRTIPKI